MNFSTQRLSDMSISQRLMLIAVLPAVAALLFAGITVVQQFRLRSGAAELAEATTLSIGLGGVVHELQKERGLSAGYIGSNGKKFADQIPQQRDQTDAQLAIVAEEVASVQDLQALKTALADLDTTRRQIDRQAVDVPTLAKRYTALVGSALSAIDGLAAANTAREQARSQTAYFEVLRSKENAGLERAMGATGFGIGRFDPATYRSFVGFIAVQDSALARLSRLSTPAQKAKLDTILASADSRAVAEFRDAAHRATETGSVLNRDADEWWTAATARIDALKQLEDGIAAQMVEVAIASRMSADIGLAVTLLILILIAGGLILLVLRITRSIIAPLTQIRKATDTIAQGDLDDAIELPGGTNELGDLATSVASLRDQLKAAEAAKAAQSALIVDSIGSGLQALAEGNLVHRVTTDLTGPFAVLRANFNVASESLNELIGATLTSAEAIRTGSGEISQAAMDLARRTESNAATLEETSASLVEVDGRVKSTATSSQETLRRADEAIGTVEHGRSVASRAVESMNAVSASAEDIDSVIGGLDKIAFQTRVLAMNAAVEAGRAGEAGRGFAVVADLVSALAMRAEEEAKRAREQLTVTQEGISSAMEAVRGVDGALDEISGGVSEVHRLIGSMAENNHAQSASLSQITSAIGDVDRATQQNAAMVEQTSAAASNLSSEVEVLVARASRFAIARASGVRPAGGGDRSSGAPLRLAS